MLAGWRRVALLIGTSLLVLAGAFSSAEQDGTISADEQRGVQRDPLGRPITPPANLPFKDGRVPVLGPEGVVGWADVYDVFGPPAGEWREEDLPPVPAAGSTPVYSGSEPGAKRIGTLGPGGFVPTGAVDDEQSPVTTILSDDS